jgi:hypothetical protein
MFCLAEAIRLATDCLLRVHARRDGHLHLGHFGGDQRGGERSSVHGTERNNNG